MHRADHAISLDLPISGQLSPNWVKRHLLWGENPCLPHQNIPTLVRYSTTNNHNF